MPACVFASLGCAFSSLHLLTRRTRGDICQHNRARLDEVEKHFPAVQAEADDGAGGEEARGADLADTPLTPPRNRLNLVWQWVSSSDFISSSSLEHISTMFGLYRFWSRPSVRSTKFIEMSFITRIHYLFLFIYHIWMEPGGDQPCRWTFRIGTWHREQNCLQSSFSLSSSQYLPALSTGSGTQVNLKNKCREVWVQSSVGHHLKQQTESYHNLFQSQIYILYFN